MIQRISIRLADVVVNSHPNAEFKHEWITYWFEKMIGRVVTYAIILLIGALLNQVLITATYLLFFVWLKGAAGGYHASSQLKCTCISALLLLIVFGVNHFVTTDIYLVFIPISLIASGVIFYIFAPVNHPNLHLNKDELVAHRKGTIIIFLIESLLILLLWLFGAPKTIIVTATLSIIIVALMVIYARMTKREENFIDEDA